MSSKIPNPFANLPEEGKVRVQAKISQEAYNQLFLQMFPYHGAQNHVIAGLMEKFRLACLRAGVPLYYDPHNETTAHELINSITFDEHIVAQSPAYLTNDVATPA